MAESSRTNTQAQGNTGGSLNNWGDLDSRLLNSEKAQNSRAGDLRRNKKQNQDVEGGEAPDSLRQQSLKSRIAKKKEQLKEKAKAKAKQLNPMYQGTKKLLKSSWVYLIASFGLTAIYINIHAFFRLIFPMFFCKLGDEWIPDEIQAKTKSTEQGKAASKMINTAEGFGLAILDLLILAIILGIAFIISMALDVISHPIEFLSTLISSWFE